jgi:hypothetical protein
MADLVVRQTVILWGEQYELTVHQKSKSVWIALGDFDGCGVAGADNTHGSATLSEQQVYPMRQREACPTGKCHGGSPPD